MEILIFAAIFWLIPIFVAHAIGKSKHRAGVLYGLFLGWLGVIIVALLPAKKAMTLAELEKRKRSFTPQQYERIRSEIVAEEHVHRQCPFCKEPMRRDATVCPHCRHESAAWTLHEGRWWTQVEDGEWRWLDEVTREWHPPTVETAAT